MKKTKSQQSFWEIFGPYLSNKGHHSQEDYVLLNDGNLIKDKNMLETRLLETRLMSIM